MILSREQIKEAYGNGGVVITPFEDKQIQPATYDLRVGEYGASTSSNKKVSIKEQGYMVINSGDFAVLETLEKVELNNQHVARFGLRSKFARKGLIATVGTQVDPGYRGRLMIGLTNLTPKPISLSYEDDFISMEFHKLKEPTKNPYRGPYQDKEHIGAEEIEFIAESEGMALSEVLNTVRSLSANVGTLSKGMDKVTTQLNSFKWIIGIFLTVISLLIAVFSWR